jgi:hypothetical protein
VSTAQTSVRYQDIISKEGVTCDPDKISSVQTWPYTDNVKELKSFLGLLAIKRRFLKSYSHIARPLNDLTRFYKPLLKRTKGKIAKKYLPVDKRRSPKIPFDENWTSACDTAFKELKSKLTSAPVLAFSDYGKPFILHMNTSATGLGAAMYQE